MTKCQTPRPATTVRLWLATLRFAARSGVTPRILLYRKSIVVAAVMLAAVWAIGVYQSWGHPGRLLAVFLTPIAILALGGVLGTAFYVAAAETWYYSPEPGKRSMLMLWPRWRISRPDKRIAGNWVAEPRDQGVGGPLLEAVLASADRRGIWLYGTAADDKLVELYLRKGFELRNDKRGIVRKPQEPKDHPPGFANSVS